MEDSRGFTLYGFVSAVGGSNSTLSIEFADGAALHLEWEELVANGDSVPPAAPGFGGDLDRAYARPTRSPAPEMDDDGDGNRFNRITPPPIAAGRWPHHHRLLPQRPTERAV
jgi:hypothetical protein